MSRFCPCTWCPKPKRFLASGAGAPSSGTLLGAATASAAAQSQQSAAAQQQAAIAQQQAATAQQQAAAAAAAGKPLPLGTVVAALPPGCTSTPVGGVEYYYCGANFYRAAFQGNNLVYVTTAQPK